VETPQYILTLQEKAVREFHSEWSYSTLAEALGRVLAKEKATDNAENTPAGGLFDKAIKQANALAETLNDLGY